MVDFTDLRRQILEGEGDEPEVQAPSALENELQDNRTRAIGAIGLAVVMVAIADKWKGIGLFRKVDDTTGVVSHDWLPFVIPASLAAAAYAAGRITRGMACQEKIERYEDLVQESETIVQELEEEADLASAEREQQAAIEQENAWVFGGESQIPSLGAMGGSPLTSVMGQEYLSYGPSADFQGRTFGF